MPVKSKAQYRRLARMVVSREISEETFAEWTEGVDFNSLPEVASESKTSGTTRKPRRTRKPRKTK